MAVEAAARRVRALAVPSKYLSLGELSEGKWPSAEEGWVLRHVQY